ncbi:MAG: hypothetical protein E5W93_11430 [Mesorhizobium sp.]|nr:MAG: hypothetical protein E5W93_11430 [Mesorhizobium sp.]TIW18449.1 MAG: hypothetical protein E5V65_12810 [Mesorhizobium sp.]
MILLLASNLKAIPGKACGGFPSGIAQKQTVRAVQRFYQTLSSNGNYCSTVTVTASFSSAWPSRIPDTGEASR